MSVPEEFDILITSGGATQQFSTVPLNCLSEGKTADYIISGYWSEKAYKEAKNLTPWHKGSVKDVGNTKEKRFSHLPVDCTFSDEPAYIHYTSNNTIVGTQYKTEPDLPKSLQKGLLVSDASSDIMSKPIDWSKHLAVYAGAQKNIGPAGVTVVIIRKDVKDKISANLPVLLDYRTYFDNKSLYNTPPCINIYVMNESLKWLKSIGGISEASARAEKRAKLLYSHIDNSTFYKACSEADRSIMNICFALPTTELESLFWKEAEKLGMVGLKGHKLFGGIRASMYNAFPYEGAEALVDFMKDFENQKG